MTPLTYFRLEDTRRANCRAVRLYGTQSAKKMSMSRLILYSKTAPAAAGDLFKLGPCGSHFQRCRQSTSPMRLTSCKILLNGFDLALIWIEFRLIFSVAQQ